MASLIISVIAIVISIFTYVRTSIWRSVDMVNLVGHVSNQRSGIIAPDGSVKHIGFDSYSRQATIENLGDSTARNVTIKIIGSDGKVKNERKVTDAIGAKGTFWIRTGSIPLEQETWIIQWDHPHWFMRLFKRRREWIHHLNS